MSAWLRYRKDKAVAMERLARHSNLRPHGAARESFEVLCEDVEIATLLGDAATFAPHADARITVHAHKTPNVANPTWLGYQKSDEIHLYPPAYRDVSTLFFTFFHEYGHWLHKRRLDWDEYLSKLSEAIALSTEADFLAVCERFANDFAWFCTNPRYLKIERRGPYEFMAHWIGGKHDGKKETAMASPGFRAAAPCELRRERTLAGGN